MSDPEQMSKDNNGRDDGRFIKDLKETKTL